ncbi:MAG: hypothetical protein ACK5JU_12590 [Bacteroidales bacterium]
MSEIEVKPRIKKGLKVLLVVLSSLFGLFIIGFLILSHLILPPERLTPMLVGMANENLNARLDCDRIELTLFSTFPNIGVRVVNGTLLSKASRSEEISDSSLVLTTDSLLHFDECIASIKPFDYLLMNKVAIHELRVVNPFMYAHVNDRGEANWDILPEDTTQTETVLPQIDLEGVRVINGSIFYDNDQDTVFMAMHGANLYLQGAMKDGSTAAYIDYNMGSFEYMDPINIFSTQQRIGFTTYLELDKEAINYVLRNAKLSINALNMEMSGLVTRPDSVGDMRMDVEFGLATDNLTELMNLVPNTLFDHSQLQAAGEVVIGGTIAGKLGKGKVPVFDIHCSIRDGKWQSNNGRLDTIQVEFNALVDMMKERDSYLHLDKALIVGENVNLQGNLQINNLLGNQHVVGYMKGDINFGRIAEKWNTNDSLTFGGTLKSDLSFDYLSSDLEKANYGRVRAKGMLDVDNFHLTSLQHGLEAMIKCVILNVDTDSERADTTSRTKVKELAGSFVVDSFEVNYKNEAKVSIQDFTLDFRGKPSRNKRDTSAIIPISAKYHLHRMALIQQDSFAIRMRNAEGSFELLPSKKDKSIPELLLSMGVDTMVVRNLEMGMMIRRMNANVVATHYAPDSVVAARIAALRAERIARGDTSNVRTRNRQESRLGDGPLASIFRKWDGKSTFNIQHGRVRNRLFPVPISIEKGTFEATTNEIKLRDTEMKIGHSDFKLSGEVENLRRTLLRNGKFIARFTIASDTIDVNEIVEGILEGMARSKVAPDSRLAEAGPSTVQDMEKRLDSLMVDTVRPVVVDSSRADTALFKIPDFIDLTLQTKARFVRIYDESLNRVDGEIIFRNGNIQLTDMLMGAEFGQAKLTMLYSPLNGKRAYAGFDLDIKKMHLDKLLDLYPPVDTMLPMLRSLEGVVDCQMAATTQLDSALNIVLPTLNAACYMHGKNMVLLDGETFAEISKKLMFKNKKRNMIDSIAVELIVRDSKVEIFPFMLNIDRYRCAVAGVQNLDMTFNYHISVLKSPLPFKIGVDVKGNIDKFTYKITGAKLKESTVASRRSIIDSTQINLRQAINDQFIAGTVTQDRRLNRILPTSTDTASVGLINTLAGDAPPPPKELIDSIGVDLGIIPDTAKKLSLLPPGETIPPAPSDQENNNAPDTMKTPSSE